MEKNYKILKMHRISKNILIALSGLIVLWIVPAVVRAQESKPNIILFFVDDNVVETMEAGGLCPNIDKLADRGVSFMRAYTPHGVCGPSRFSVLSGRYMSRCISETQVIPESRIHGSAGIGGLTIEGQRFIWSGSLLSEEWNAGKLMQHGGYKTFFTGKVHHHMQSAPVDEKLEQGAKDDPWKAQELMRRRLQASGWDWAEALSKGNLTNHARTTGGIEAGNHNPEWRAQATIDFIEKNKAGPFFCYIAENLMHMPHPGIDIDLPSRIAFDGIVFDEDFDVMPSRASVWERLEAAGHKGNKNFAGLLWLDDMIGAIVNRLEELDLRKNTVIAFIQDNGHHWDGKNTVYEGGIHVSPAIISWPAGIKDPGRECHQLVSSIDFIPSFMELGGIEKPEDCILDGVSLVPLLRGVDKPVRESVYAEMGHSRAIVTPRWKYLAYRVPESRQYTEEEKVLYQEWAKKHPPDIGKGINMRPGHMQNSNVGGIPASYLFHKEHYFDADQLYDLNTDPSELKNLADDPVYAEILGDMKEKLREYCLDLPGIFAEFKTLVECPDEFRALLTKAQKEPMQPISTKRRISN